MLGRNLITKKANLGLVSTAFGHLPDPGAPPVAKQILRIVGNSCKYIRESFKCKEYLCKSWNLPGVVPTDEPVPPSGQYPQVR